jgi:hypothetical protein
MRLDLRKLFIRQPELVSIHLRFLSEAVNHNPPTLPTLLWVWTLDYFRNCHCVRFCIVIVIQTISRIPCESNPVVARTASE